MARSRQRASRNNPASSSVIVLDDDEDCQVAERSRRDEDEDCQVATVISNVRPVMESGVGAHAPRHEGAAAAADLLELRLGLAPFAAAGRHAPVPPSKRRRSAAADVAAQPRPGDDCQVLFEVGPHFPRWKQDRDLGRHQQWPPASTSVPSRLPLPLGFGKEAPPAAPPRELALTCAICLSAMKEESSTVCGHIFCRSCIFEAVSAQKKCPTCRRKLATSQIHRIYLASSAG